jgi:hypothetical protein
VLAEADWILTTRGGRGALRELVDDVVEARGLWDEVLADYETRQAQKSSPASEPDASAE